MQLVNGAHVLNATRLSLSYACLPAALSNTPVGYIFSLTRIYGSLKSLKLDISTAVLNLI